MRSLRCGVQQDILQLNARAQNILRRNTKNIWILVNLTVGGFKWSREFGWISAAHVRTERKANEGQPRVRVVGVVCGWGGLVLRVCGKCGDI